MGKYAKVEKVKIDLMEHFDAPKTLSLDEIEQKMIELATDDSADMLRAMVNEKKMAMLEKVANLKIHRLQVKHLENDGNNVLEIQPVQIEYIGSSVSDLDRVKKMEEVVEKQLGIDNHQS